MGIIPILGLRIYRYYALTVIVRLRTTEQRILRNITIVLIAEKRLLLILHGVLSVLSNIIEFAR